MGAFKSRLAGAAVPVDTVHASRAVQARVGSTLVEVYLAVTPDIPRRAFAKVSINQVFALACMLAGIT